MAVLTAVRVYFIPVPDTIFWVYDESHMAPADKSAITQLAFAWQLLTTRYDFGRKYKDRVLINMKTQRYLHFRPERWPGSPAIITALSGANNKKKTYSFRC